MDANNTLRNFSFGNFDANITEDLEETLIIPAWCEMIIIVYLYLTAILAICGNCIILLVETNNRYKTSTDWLVSFMASTDILFVIFPLPMYIVIQMGLFADIASDAICKLFRFVEYMTTFSSAMLLGTVAIDRYFKTCRPHKQFLTPTRALRCCIGITAAACLLNSSTFAIVIYEGGDECGFRELAGGVWIGSLMSIFISSYIFMFATVGFCYIRVAYTIKTKLYDHSITMAGATSTTAKETPTVTNVKDNMTSKPMILHKTNKVVPLIDAADDSQNEPKTQTSRELTLQEFQLFDQSSDSGNSRNLNSKSKKDVYPAPNQECSHTVARTPQPQQPSYGKQRYDTRVDRTTKIMFAVTLVFVLTWLPTWCSYLYRSASKYKPTFTGAVITFFTRKTYMINTFMNPIFYIWMSSAFKEKTRQTLKKLFSKCKKIM